MRTAVAVVAGYLVGTFPSADLAALMATGRSDLRSRGSGNPGGVNVAQTVGPGWGYAVMAADVVKGAVAAGAGRRLAGGTGANLGGAAAVVGHCYPVWNGFRGGKGVAASIGQVLVTFPAYVPVDTAVATLTVASPRWKRRAFAATAVASLTWVGASLLWWRTTWPNAWGPEPGWALPAGAVVSSLAIYSRFRAGSQGSAEGRVDEAEPR